MQRGFTIQSKVDGLVLDGLVVEPEEGVQRTALLQLSHGMSEYKERYLPFMEFMAEPAAMRRVLFLRRGLFPDFLRWVLLPGAVASNPG